MSQEPIQEINALLKEAKRVCNAASGEAIGGLSDTLTVVLTQIGQKLLQSENRANGLQKELDALKKSKKTDKSDHK